MTSPNESRIATNQEFIRDVIGWDGKHAGRYLRYGKTINAMVIPEPFQSGVALVLEGIEDSFKRNDREAGRIRERVLIDAMLAAQAAGVTPDSSERMCTQGDFERILESLTAAALGHRIQEKVRVAAAACFAKPGEIATPIEMEVAHLIGDMPLHAIREVQDHLVACLGPGPFDQVPSTAGGAPYRFPIVLLRKDVCTAFIRKHWGTQAAWTIVPEADGQMRGRMFIRTNVSLAKDAGDAESLHVSKPHEEQGRLGNGCEVWPTEEAIIFHRTIELEKEMLRLELKLSRA